MSALSEIDRAKLLLTCAIVADLLRMGGDNSNAVDIAMNYGVLNQKLAYLKKLGCSEYDLHELKSILQ